MYCPNLIRFSVHLDMKYLFFFVKNWLSAKMSDVLIVTAAIEGLHAAVQTRRTCRSPAQTDVAYLVIVNEWSVLNEAGYIHVCCYF